MPLLCVHARSWRTGQILLSLKVALVIPLYDPVGISVLRVGAHPSVVGTMAMAFVWPDRAQGLGYIQYAATYQRIKGRMSRPHAALRSYEFKDLK